jgi:hypothetical protein
MALDVDVSLVVGVDSASNDVSVDADVCMEAILELIAEQGFELRSTDSVGVNGGPDLSVYLFTKHNVLVVDVATLYCIADININPGGPGGPGGPCGPGGPGGPGGC